MEVLELAGYTEDEKLVIAKQFLIPRQIRENGITSKDINLGTKVLREIIVKYTLEPGLRNLEREIAGICRKIARKVAEDEKGPFKVTRANLHKYLGVPKYLPELEQDYHEVGVATGLACTQAGGEILYVEVSVMKGKGELILTGQLGEVMQESSLELDPISIRIRTYTFMFPLGPYPRTDLRPGLLWLLRLFRL